MRTIFHVCFCAGRDAGIVEDRSDVVRFAVVVPRHNFDELGEQGEGLVPTEGPGVVAAPDPGFVVLGEIGVEPG